MDEYLLLRSYLHDRTVGELFENHEKGLFACCVTLERPWLNNASNISCIPEGSYIVKRDKTGRHQYYAVQNVAKRSAIEFHSGVLPQHSAGCILLGEGHTPEFNLNNSKSAMNDFLASQSSADFLLTIRARQASDHGLMA